MNNDLKVVYHIAVKENFIQTCNKDNYKPSDFDADGFIHCTGEPDTTLVVLDDYFQQITKEIVLIQIAVDRLTSVIKFEKPAPIKGGGTNHVKEGLLFPHIYGALNLDAIIGAAIVEQRDGEFVWPDKFMSLDKIVKTDKMVITSSEIRSVKWEGLSIHDFTSNQDTQSSFAKIEISSGAKHKLSWSKVSEKFYYVLTGQLHFMIDNSDYVVNSGDLCIVPVNTRFAYMNKSNSTVEILLIHSPKFNIENEIFEDDYYK